MNQLIYFWLLLKASLFSTSGTGNLPSLHNDLIPLRWATDNQFGEALAIGQISPGPTGLWVVSFGYLTDGFRGVLLSVIAITLPPLLILGVERLYRRVQHHPAVEGFVTGLGLAMIGVFVVILGTLLVHVGLDVKTVVICVGSICLALTRRAPVIVILVIAGLAGVLMK